MEVLSSIGGAILSASFQALFTKLGSQDLLKYIGSGNVADELKKWYMMLKKIYLVLDDAEEKQMANPLVKMWISELRDLAYDVDDILDDFATDQALRKLEDEQVARTSMLRKFIPSCRGRLNFSTLKFNAQMITRIKKMTERFDVIMKQKDCLHLCEGGKRKTSQIREKLATTSLLEVNEAKIYGREKDKEEIIKLLKAEVSDVEISVLPIIGLGGIGKTTLSQLVFNDVRLKFDFRAWVSVGEEFDVLKMTKAILQPDINDEKKDLNWHQMKLKEKLHQKKCLIVLDDVWNESYDHWTLFCCPLREWAQGSRIIITTRNGSVSNMTGTVAAYSLKELSDDDCLTVFAQHALGLVNFDMHPYLKATAKEIVRRCRGLPLAAKALGGLLRVSYNPRVWENVLNNNIWDLPEECSILPALRLSYFHLPSHLKLCFAYCATFPKDFEFDRNELVLLWMAEGFVSKSVDMQDLGGRYFDDLLSRSFFQQSNSNKSRYVMHDLAQSVNREMCFHWGDKLDFNSHGKMRYSSFISGHHDTWKKFEEWSEMKSLRSLLAIPIMASYCCNYLTNRVMHDMVPKLKCLRALSLSGYNIVEVPNSIGALKHLRYLNLSYTEIERLPESTINLLKLQTLILRGCGELTEIPSGLCNLTKLHWLDISGCEKLTELPLGISNLTNLLCLDVSGTDQLQQMPPQIGNLGNLHMLTELVVGKESGLKLTELKKMSQLQGKLCIRELQNVMDARDADFADLKMKHGIEELQLVWRFSRNQSDEMKVLNSLRPHGNLPILSIRGFGGTDFSSWVGDPTFNKMVKLTLSNCWNISSLPKLSRLPSLEILNIDTMNGVKKVGDELYGCKSSCFASLETLCIEDMMEWKEWWCCDDLNEDTAVRFPKLHHLRIKNCPKLVQKLPSSLPFIRKFCVEWCRESLLRNMSGFTSLTTLEISGILGLLYLDDAHMKGLVALKELKIRYCPQLKYVWKYGTNLERLASLETLIIQYCKEMVLLMEGEEGELPCNLQTLKIDKCCNLEKLPNGLHQLTCLTDLKIISCDKLKSFPARGVPYGLKHLEIIYCGSLEFVPEGIMSDGNRTSVLEELVIKGCDSLKSFPCGQLTNCVQIGIENWPTQLFKSLWSSLALDSYHCGFSCLTSLRIGNCCHLESFPEAGIPIYTLTSLYIYNCKNLMSLPNHMQNLTSLQTLEIKDCEVVQSFPTEGLPPNLTNFMIWNCENLKQPMSEWGLHRLESLTDFTIKGTMPKINSFPDNDGLLLLHTSRLWISDFKNLKSISSGILNLTSLQSLDIWNCPNLQFLPKHGFPLSLGQLSIYECPLMKEWCLKHRRDRRSIIFHIPLLKIDNKSY